MCRYRDKFRGCFIIKKLNLIIRKLNHRSQKYIGWNIISVVCRNSFFLRLPSYLFRTISILYLAYKKLLLRAILITFCSDALEQISRHFGSRCFEMRVFKAYCFNTLHIVKSCQPTRPLEPKRLLGLP